MECGDSSPALFFDGRASIENKAGTSSRTPEESPRLTTWAILLRRSAAHIWPRPVASWYNVQRRCAHVCRGFAVKVGEIFGG